MPRHFNDKKASVESTEAFLLDKIHAVSRRRGRAQVGLGWALLLFADFHNRSLAIGDSGEYRVRLLSPSEFGRQGPPT